MDASEYITHFEPTVFGNQARTDSILSVLDFQ
jgi:hypothetical protein